MSETSVVQRDALVHRTGACAVVIEDGKAVALIEVNSNGEVTGPRPVPEGLHLGMWLQPSEARSVFVDDPPYTGLIQSMIETVALHNIIYLVTVALNPTFDMSTRHIACTELEECLAKLVGRPVDARFREIVLGVEWTDEVSTRDAPFIGRSKEIFDQAIAKWGYRPRNV